MSDEMEFSVCNLKSGNKRNCDDTEPTSSEQKQLKIDEGYTNKIRHDPKVSRYIANKLYEMQKCGEFCDYELKTEDGGTFKVHKWVLSTTSPFFAKLLDKNMPFSEQNSDTFLVRQVSSNILEKIIEFMYTGYMEISFDTAKEIINIALFLTLFSVVEYGFKILVEFVNEENCLEWIEYSEKCLHYGEELAKKCLELICGKFDHFVNLPDFLLLSSDTIKLLVVQETKTYTEENLYLAVKKWITYDLEERKQFAKILFDPINFKYFSSKFAQEHIFDDNPLLKADGFKDKLISLLQNNWMRTGSNLMEDVNMFGVFQNNVFCFDYREVQFSEFIARIDHNRKNFVITTFDKKNILVCGKNNSTGFYTSLAYFSIENRRWNNLPSLSFSIRPTLITLGDNIYAFRNGSANINIFNIGELKWYESIDRILTPDDQFSLCHSNNSIYYVASNSVQRIDLSLKSEILYSGDFGINVLSSETNGNFIYGFTQDDIRTFDIRNNKWLDTTKPYGIELDNPKICIFDNKIHVFSGSKRQLQIYNLSDLSFYDSKTFGLKANDANLQAIFSL